ncbi:retropepsin-like aspartic protease family protein [Aliidiomarina quisquiliarum]|uniref:retropepsin-like aspartic protease family protein n=1 Tax=Aliidiomarina quisquiliarum TaxID=2938947 RepID=UPI00208E0FCA|nr:TIGR02281 family clan AA aspartic protease [Aliidiomarina quisquiliarum]MCO4321481.1 TIGR02281 family clan AA aspartic protease [Aliidiomarina quisquiliarum]
MANSHDSSKTIGRFFIWFAWLGALALLYYFFDGALSKQQNPNQQVESYRQGNQAVVVLQQNRAGHYVANGSINQRPVTFLLDTGATQVAIPGSLASHLGLRQGQQIQVRTANGVAIAYQTELAQLQLGDILLNNVAATIVPDYHSNHILLGMSALRALEFSQRDRQLTIRQ